MLYIKQTSVGITRIVRWHIGEPVPPIYARVVEFQADGDELVCLLDAMQKSGMVAPEED